jgi:hypothetical protein
MIEARGLGKRHGATAAVDDLTFTIRPGMVGLVGLADVAGKRSKGFSRGALAENQARSVARLVAWDRKRSLRDQLAFQAGRERAHDTWRQAPDRRTPTCADTSILIRNG